MKCQYPLSVIRRTCSAVSLRLIALVFLALSSLGRTFWPAAFSRSWWFKIRNKSIRECFRRRRQNAHKKLAITTLALICWLLTVRTRAIDFLTTPILASLAAAPPVTWATRSYDKKKHRILTNQQLQFYSLKFKHTVESSSLSSLSWARSSVLLLVRSSCALTFPVVP
jgi:dolichol kinase